MFVTPEFAEVLGVLLGDGCVSRSFQGATPHYQVAFTGNSSEFSYYDGFVRPTLEQTFGVTGRVFLRNDNTTRFHVSGSRLALALVSMGIPLGRKRDACIPPAVLVSKQVVPFIRGIYHAEGSIYRRYSKMYNRMKRIYSNLLVIQIRMKLPTLMRQISEEIRKLGISTNRLSTKDGVYTLRITNQGMIRRFLDIVKPRFKLAPRASL